jgi:hypothetical protein
MRRFAISLAILVPIALVMGASLAHAEYVKNGALISDAGDQYYGPALVKVPGGAIIAWADNRNGNMDVFAQKVDSTGLRLWNTDGVAICTAVEDQDNVRMVSDGAGGSIIVWTDKRSGVSHIYAQRIDADGNVLWAPDGISICTASLEQTYPQIITGGVPGGAIIAWWDNRTGYNNSDIYAQSVDGDGNALWTPDGIAVCSATGNQYNTVLIPDGAHGAILSWEDNRVAEGDLYIQRVDSTGAALWNADGVAVCTASSYQIYPRLASDGNFGAFIAWTDNRDGNYDVYMQRFDQNGYPYWYTDGIDIAKQTYYEVATDIVPDGAGGVIVVCGEDRDVEPGIYAMRISEYGYVKWLWSGIPICTVQAGPEEPRAVPDGSGGAVIAWEDYRKGHGDIYAQKIDATGEVLWTTDGVLICGASDDQVDVGLAADGDDGAVIAWRDARGGSACHTYAQRISGEGLWGNPEPSIVWCHDAPDDQGGYVRIKMKASSHDISEEKDYPITGYDVWREIHSLGGGLLATEGASPAEGVPLYNLFEEAANTPGARISRIQAAALGFPPGDWESLGLHAAKQDTVYYFAVPTENDSTESGAGWETYVVTAHTPTTSIVIVSNCDSAYSVDNLAPPITAGFAGAETASPHGLSLTWTPNEARDLWKYDVFRGDDALFTPDESNRIGTTDETTLFDGSWANGYNYFYKLVAVDRHGNSSAAALLGPEDVKVGTLLQSFAASFSLGAIEVEWRLSEAAVGMSFVVMRAEGPSGPFAEIPDPVIGRKELSFTFKDAGVEPNTEYRYRVEVSDEAGRRILFETEAISTPALPFTLYQTHPNPFNPSTTIRYYLSERCGVVLDVFDSSGRRVARLVNESQPAGSHTAVWTGLDDQKRGVGTGVYFYRLTAGKKTTSRKMVLIR